jgi:hypothetical protein
MRYNCLTFRLFWLLGLCVCIPQLPALVLTAANASSS